MTNLVIKLAECRKKVQTRRLKAKNVFHHIKIHFYGTPKVLCSDVGFERKNKQNAENSGAFLFSPNFLFL